VTDQSSEAHAYIDELELADARGRPLAVSRGSMSDAPPIDFTTTPQAVAAGSQMVEFDASVDPKLRSAITNALLLAQLAANKAAPSGPVEAWYGKYAEVLSHIGWVTGDLSFKATQFDGEGLDVHRAIAGVLAAALGPAAAAASIVLAALKGLESMAGDSPWLVLFDKASRHTTFNSFQLSYGSVQGGAPVLTLLCFAVDASDDTTQVLFFKYHGAHATLRQYSGEVRAATDILMATSDKVATLVGASASDYLSEISL
jgi:hypothetical protein